MPAEFVGLYLDPETNDLALDASGSLRLARREDAVAQHVRQRLKTFVGEWVYDLEAGLPWLPGNRTGFAIFDRPFQQGLADAVVKAAVLGTAGVIEITGYESRVDRASRGFFVEVEASVQTPDGADFVTIPVSLEASFFVDFSTEFTF